MKKYLLALTLLAAACGAQDDGPEDTIGTTELAITAPRTNTYVLGTTNTQAGLRCTVANATQICNVPTTRLFSYCLSGLNAEEIPDISALRAGGNSANLHFNWTELTSGGNPVRDAACETAFHNGQVNVLVNHIDNFCASAGASTTNIDTLVCFSPNPPGAQLVESPSVNGSFFGITGGVIHIDRARLSAGFPITSERQKVRQHGLGHAAAGVDGLGARTESFTTFLWTRRQVLPLELGRTHSAGEDCTLSFYSSAGTQYNQDTAHCSVD